MITHKDELAGLGRVATCSVMPCDQYVSQSRAPSCTVRSKSKSNRVCDKNQIAKVNFLLAPLSPKLSSVLIVESIVATPGPGSS